MEKILIVSDTKETAQALSSSLSSLDITTVLEESFDASLVLKRLKDSCFELIVINSQKDAEKACELAFTLRKKSDINLLLMVESSDAAKISDKLSRLGIFVLSAPFKDWEVRQAVNFINSTHTRFDSLKKEKDGLEKKVEDMKIIDRAKCCLIHYLRIPEATAHRHIEKQAMDMRCTKRQIAEEILKKYES